MTILNFKTVCSLVYAITVIVNVASSSKLPKGFVQCKKSDPKFNDCVKSGIQSGIPHLVKGVPSLGLMKIDPLRIEKLEIVQGTGPVSINMKFNDLDVYNLKSLIVSKVQSDIPNLSAEFEVITGPLLLNGTYEIAGKVLVLPIVGKGKCKFSLELKKLFGSLKMKTVDRNGVTYLEIEKLSFKFTPTNVGIKLDNLFNGDKVLGDNMNKFLNENWRVIYSELQPVIEIAISSAFKEIGRQFLRHVPFDKLFLE